MKKPKKETTREKTSIEKLGSALASTIAFLAPKDPDTDPHPPATDLLVHHHRRVEALLERMKKPKSMSTPRSASSPTR